MILSETHPSGWEVRCTPPKHVSLFVELLFNWFRSDALICNFWDRRKVFYQGSCGESDEDRLLWLPSDSIARLCIPSEYGARKEAESVERGIGMGWVRAQSPKTPPLSWSSPGVKHGSPRELTGSQWITFLRDTRMTSELKRLGITLTVKADDLCLFVEIHRFTDATVIDYIFVWLLFI